MKITNKQPLKRKWTDPIDNSGKFHSAWMGQGGSLWHGCVVHTIRKEITKYATYYQIFITLGNLSTNNHSNMDQSALLV